MDNNRRLFFLLIFIWGFLGCGTNSKSFSDIEKTKIVKCRDKWVYSNLSKEKLITVILFSSKFNHDIHTYPNFLIGISDMNDTIAFLDKDFDGTLKVGTRIKVLPHEWTETEKAIKKPVFAIHKKSHENELYCRIDTVFYGKISF